MIFLKKIFFAAFAVAAFSSCQKNISEFVPDGSATPDVTWHAALNNNMPVISLKNDLLPGLMTGQFNFTNADIVYANGSLTLTAQSNSLVTVAGTVATGDITQRSMLIRSKGDIIRSGMPTVSGDRLLVSGGAFFMDLKRGADSVFVPQNKKITVKFSTNATAPGMVVYHHAGNVVSGYNWEPSTAVNYNFVNFTGTGLEVSTNKMQWVQAAYLFDTIGIPQTRLTVKLPENYTNANTQVFIVFNDMHCVAPAQPMMNTKTFESGLLPANRAVTVVVLSKQSGDYYYAAQPITTAVNTQQVACTPVRMQFSAVLTHLANL